MLHHKPNVNRTDGPRPQTKRLGRARQIMRLRHDAIRTERSYTHWMRRYILFHDKRHPQDRGPAEIEVFLTHLAVQGTIALLTPRFHTEHLGVNPAAPSTEAGVALHFIYYEGLFDVFNEELEHLGESRPARD